MSPPRIRATFTTVAPSGPPRVARPYLWRNTPGWDPAAAGGPVTGRGKARGQKTTEARNERYRRFAAARAAGASIRQAARYVDVGERTAQNYERERERGKR